MGLEPFEIAPTEVPDPDPVRPRGLRADALPEARAYPPSADEIADELGGPVPPPEQESLFERMPQLLAPRTAPFTKREVREMRTELVDALGDYCELVDLFVSHTNKNGAECHIWRDLDSKDLGAFADVMLHRATRSAKAATAVVQIVAWRSYAKAGAVGVDAALRTFDFYKEQGGFALWFPSIIPVPWRTAA